jgi:hypothetical protein
MVRIRENIVRYRLYVNFVYDEVYPIPRSVQSSFAATNTKPKQATVISELCVSSCENTEEDALTTYICRCLVEKITRNPHESPHLRCWFEKHQRFND